MGDQKKVEFIESYIKIGNGDYKWNDNHGELVRCKDCRQNNQCSIQFKFADPDCPGEWYCAYGEKNEKS